METVIPACVSLQTVKHRVSVRVIPGAFSALQLFPLQKQRPRWLEMQVAAFRVVWDPWGCSPGLAVTWCLGAGVAYHHRVA